MHIYLITCSFGIYVFTIILCESVGFTKAAKAGFVLIAAGLLLMMLGTICAWNRLAETWNRPYDMDFLFAQMHVWGIVSYVGTGIALIGAGLSFAANLYRVVVRRKEIFQFRRSG